MALEVVDTRFKKGIIPWMDKKNCNPDNLLTLCKNCHQKTNFNRKYWIKCLTRKRGKNEFKS